MNDWLNTVRHPQLPDVCANDHSLAKLSETLRLYPWQWPDPDRSPERFERAVEIAKRAGPPRLRVGVVPVVTYSERGVASLWALDPNLHEVAGLETCAWAPEVHDVWRTALTAVNRRADALWTPTQRLALPLVAVHIASAARENTPLEREPVLRDRSFGLAFAVSMLSRLLDEPIPADVALSGEVDSVGRVRAVREAEKSAMLVRCAPHIRRWVVGPASRDTSGTPAPGLKTIRCSDVADAFAACGLDPDRVLASKLEDAEGLFVKRIVRDLFLTAIRGGEYEWSGYQRAVEAIRERQIPLAAADEQRLGIAYAIIQRHQAKQCEPFPIPSAALLSELHRPTREKLIAHMVQHATDEGVPARVDALAHADRALGANGPQDLTDTELRILGARARLLFAMGRAEEAHRASRDAAEAYFARGLTDQVSFPLSFWYRCIGVMRGAGDLAAADALYSSVQATGQLAPYAEKFVLVSRAAALGLMGKPEDEATDRALNVVLEERNSIHLRRSALRALHLQFVASRAGAGTESLGGVYNEIRQSRLLHSSATSDDQSLERYVAILALDHAVALGNGEFAVQAMDEVMSACGRLLADVRACTPANLSVLEQADRLRSFFPY